MSRRRRWCRKAVHSTIRRFRLPAPPLTKAEADGGLEKSLAEGKLAAANFSAATTGKTSVDELTTSGQGPTQPPGRSGRRGLLDGAGQTRVEQEEHVGIERHS